jgi:hypothetical protein
MAAAAPPALRCAASAQRCAFAQPGSVADADAAARARPRCCCGAPRAAARRVLARGAPAAGGAAGAPAGASLSLSARRTLGATSAARLTAAPLPPPLHALRRRRAHAPGARGRCVAAAAASASAPAPREGGASLLGAVRTRVRAAFAPLDGLWLKLIPMSALFFFMAFANSVLDRRAPARARARARALCCARFCPGPKKRA